MFNRITHNNPLSKLFYRNRSSSATSESEPQTNDIAPEQSQSEGKAAKTKKSVGRKINAQGEKSSSRSSTTQANEQSSTKTPTSQVPAYRVERGGVASKKTTIATVEEAHPPTTVRATSTASSTSTTLSTTSPSTSQFDHHLYPGVREIPAEMPREAPLTPRTLASKSTSVTSNARTRSTTTSSVQTGKSLASGGAPPATVRSNQPTTLDAQFQSLALTPSPMRPTTGSRDAMRDSVSGYSDHTMLDAILSPDLPEDCNPVIVQEMLFTSAGMQTTCVVVDSGHPHSLGVAGYHSWAEDAKQVWQPMKSKGKWEKGIQEAIRTYDARELVLAVLESKKKAGRNGDSLVKLRTVLSDILHEQPSRFFRWASQQLRDVFLPVELPSLPPSTLATLFVQQNEAKFTAAVEYAWHSDGRDLAWDVADTFLQAAEFLVRGNVALEPFPNNALLPRWRRAVAQLIVADTTARKLWSKLTTVPPSIMRQCHAQGRKWETFAAARIVRSLADLAYFAKTPVVGDQIDKYVRLACLHDSGHTIDALLVTFPELRSTDNLDQIVKYGLAFNARKILMLALHCTAPAPIRAAIIGPAPYSDGPVDKDIPDVLRPDAKAHLASILTGHQRQPNATQATHKEAYA
ncbi:hypothetical protein MW7_009005 [Imbroritus primus]|uniref:Uncharacterized protein n=1 Tax=Imbroritus primus TaxID=3058603 RepID=A0ACD3SRB8_9BURK|nr:hypothetical protein MW7_009005 [Burkholderiaceae bacterium PBA]